MNNHTGPARIIDGHPVPYSATVQRQRADDGEWESVKAIRHLSEINDWMKLHRPGKTVLRTDGAYFFYT